MRIYKLFIILGGLFSLFSCANKENIIVVGATPSPHSEILESSIVKDYINKKGYSLKVKVYQDYITPNKALNDYGLDANYFQHIPFLNEEISKKHYDIAPICQVHYEPLNLYSKNQISDFTNKTIHIINDYSNAERAFALLQDHNIIDSYDFSNFNPQHPIYTSSKNVTIKCINEGLLSNIVNDNGIAIIPGNFALTAWGSEVATSYKILSEKEEVAIKKANVIVSRNDNKNDPKINVLVEALSQVELKTFIESKYGPTVVYSYKDLR